MNIMIDLHCHSTASDGVLSPADVVYRAAQNGVRLLALTDHDTLAGVPQAQAAAAKVGVNLLTGVEVSAAFEGDMVHIVGLDVDLSCQLLQQGLENIRSVRMQRAHRIGAALEKAGMPGLFDDALKLTAGDGLVGSMHFARAMVARKIALDTRTVFQHYLVAGKPGFVEYDWVNMDEVLAWIHAAGGVAVIAHPWHYKLTPARLEALFKHFAACSGEAVEVAAQKPSAERILLLARRYGLQLSIGSDFHDPEHCPVDLGACLMPPESVSYVWRRWLG